MSTTEPVAYTYKAEQLCPNCMIDALGANGKNIPADSYSDEETIRTIAERAGIDYSNPYSYDSDDFPKPIFRWQLDCPGIGYEGDPDDDHELCNNCHRRLCG